MSRGLDAVFLHSMPEEGDWSEGIDALARSIAGSGATVVFAVGGDGTVGACAQAIAGSSAALAIVPAGTANLLAYTLRIPFSLEGALAVGFGGGRRRIDLALAEGRAFVAMAGIGVDAAVVEGTPLSMKRRLGWPAYAVAGLASLARRPHEVEVRIDDQVPLRRQAQAVVVGNLGILPGGFVLLAGARLDDGQLDVGVLSPRGVVDWLVVGAHLLARHASAGSLVPALMLPRSRDLGGHLEHRRARRVAILAEAPLSRQVDGEILPPGRELTVALSDETLEVCVPTRRRRPA